MQCKILPQRLHIIHPIGLGLDDGGISIPGGGFVRRQGLCHGSPLRGGDFTEIGVRSDLALHLLNKAFFPKINLVL